MVPFAVINHVCFRLTISITRMRVVRVERGRIVCYNGCEKVKVFWLALHRRDLTMDLQHHIRRWVRADVQCMLIDTSDAKSSMSIIGSNSATDEEVRPDIYFNFVMDFVRAKVLKRQKQTAKRSTAVNLPPRSATRSLSAWPRTR